MNKVTNGTPRNGPSICLNCRSAHVIKGMNFENEIYCRSQSNANNRVKFPITECSLFDDKRNPSLYDMEQIAWVIKSRNRGPVGFTDDSRTEITVDPPEPRFGGIGPAIQHGKP